MKVSYHCLVICLILLSNITNAQLTQTVKGKIVDKEIGTGLPGAIVQLKGINVHIVATADNNGFYKLLNVPVGRQSFLFTYTGYKPVPVSDIIVTSGKEMIVNIEMEESTVAMEEVEVK
ncbi:MAG: carboxypeptidase-like regulatory domain-containing protein, partial [Bacteroidia bacterium]